MDIRTKSICAGLSEQNGDVVADGVTYGQLYGNLD